MNDTVLSDAELADLRPIEKPHPALPCSQCGKPLAFIEYGHKLGKNGKEAKWPIYDKCVNPACISGRKNLQREGKIVPHAADPRPELNAIGAKHAAKAAAKGKTSLPPVTISSSVPYEERKEAKVEAVVPTVPVEQTEDMNKSVARAARVVGIPDRTTYRYYQLDTKNRIGELQAICRAYKPGAIKMLKKDLEAIVADYKPDDMPRVEKLSELQYQLVCGAGNFPIYLIEGLSPFYFYVAAELDKKIQP